MNKNSSSIFWGALTAALLAIAPAATAADSTMSAPDKSSGEYVQAQQKSMQMSVGVTDSDLTERVRRALETHSGITAEARNGVIDVSGTVRTGSEKSDILKRAHGVQGVRSVTDGITVVHSGAEGIGAYIDDASITTVVKGRFIGQSGLDSMDISVDTTNGVVTLTGEVESRGQVDLAEGVAKNAGGVKSVVNHLTYKQ
ncbi:MAG: BON domain-containing protein [Desulfovibrionaceae bacterium]|nr:BON domain-containing protein [Desulfovibrionaceae bacterium]